MMSEEFIQNLDKLLGVTDDEGRVVVQVCLFFTLYFEGAHLPETRSAVATCFEEYERLYGDHLRWIKHPRTFKFHPYGSPKIPSVRQWLERLSPESGWEFMVHGGQDRDAASNFHIKALGSSAAEPELSYLQVTLPINWYVDHEGNFTDVAIRLCSLIAPVSGYGGLGIIQSPNDILENQFEPQVFDLAQRFPGLEVDYPYSHVLYLHEGIKGVNWLTFVGNRWLEKLGGSSVLKEQLGEDFSLFELPSGMLIKAGQLPQTGDAQRGSVPKLYARLAALLRPIRVQYLGSFHHFGPHRFDKNTTTAWLARFDS